jgi:membrane protease YdiL (CAAX protease family)
MLSHFNLLPAMSERLVSILRLAGTIGPAVSAMIVTRVAHGKGAVGALWAQLKRRAPGKYYAAAIFVFPILLFASAGIYLLLPGHEPLPFQEVTAGSIVTVAIILIISVLGEELGWRGFALPRMQSRWSALAASLILGTIWTVWHLPFWAILDELKTFGPYYWLISWAFIMAGSVFLTWAMNNTGYALILAFLFHWVYNILAVAFLPLSTVVPAYLILTGLAWAMALFLIWRYGPRELSRAPRTY